MPTQLKSMSIAALAALRDRVQSTLNAKIAAERRVIKAKLEKAYALSGEHRSMKGRKVAPKFRNARTGETWAGRGLMPLWLRGAIKGGRKLESFRV